MNNLTNQELAAEIKRLTTLKAWGPGLSALETEAKRRQPIELAQDAYYYGTAADMGGAS